MEEMPSARFSLLPEDATSSGESSGVARYSAALLRFRVGSATAAIVGVLALLGVAAQVAQSESQVPGPLSMAELKGLERRGIAASEPGAVMTVLNTKSQDVFDASGRFIMRDFDKFKPMASFLPGVGGLWGVPMWTFYVNRGQGIATFGVKNKPGGILLFQTADKAYQVTPYVGFRTLLKGKRASGAIFETQPFFPTSDSAATNPPTRNMLIGNNELEIEEVDPNTGIRTNVLYFTAPNEDFPALVRRVTFTNQGADEVELEVVDGLAKLEPEGGLDKLAHDKQIIEIGRTLEAWMHVYNFDQEDKTAPFFHFVIAPADTADVQPIKDGHFAVAVLEDDANVGSDGSHTMLPMICDQQLVFGTDTTLTVPRRFFSNSEKPEGTPLAELLKEPQSITSRTPSAFAAASLKLKPGESKTISIIYGHAPDVETFVTTIVPKVKAQGYVASKRSEASGLGTILTERVSMSSAVPQLDAYAKQNYLDNLLRGGMPMQIGSDAAPNAKIFHAFSRIHGDLERDYNNFVIDQTYWSQGPGNSRDVNQNRRCDVLQLPATYDFNVRQFLSYTQHDGYNSLTVATALFKIRDPSRVAAISDQLAQTAANAESAKPTLLRLLSAAFRPGQLFSDLAAAGVKLSMDRAEVLELVTHDAQQEPAAQYPQSQNGFWTDHFSYDLDLVKNFVAVYPDKKEEMLFDSELIPFYLSPGRVTNRTEKNMLAGEGKIRQYDAVLNSTAKVAQLAKIYADPQYVSGPDGGADWQLTASGKTMKVSIIAKLITLAANKFAIMDPLGMGLEMEAGKPGWNDAMNGLPALFGSEMPSAYELQQIVKFVGEAIDEIRRPVKLPQEVSALLEVINAQLLSVASKVTTDFQYWDKVHDGIEAYRASTEATFTGSFVEWAPGKLGQKSGTFGAMLRRMDQGITRAKAYSQAGVSPTYFKFAVSKFELTGAKSTRGLPTVKVLGFDEPTGLPLFLEGPTRQLKTITDRKEQEAVYEAVRWSDLKDTKLSMYKISASLADMTMEVGRMKAFDAGWLENESIWLHMSYKWYLELLRAGLYEVFFKEIKTGVVAFMDPAVLGRPPLEAASFIVSSAFPDKTLHGSGFLARLSGSTAEFLSMWNHMMVGATPFTLDADKKLQLSLAPVIASWLWKADGTLTFTFLGAIHVKYVMASKKNSWEAVIKSYVLTGPNGKVRVEGPVVPSPMAEAVRSLEYTAITVTLE